MEDESSNMGEEYNKMLLLEELESLLEEWDEGLVESTPENNERLRDLQVGTREELARRINELHADLDRSEG